MKSITVNIEVDQDLKLLMGFIKSAQFSGQVEAFENEDEFTDEDIAEWDKRMAEYDKDPSKGKTLEQVKEILKQRHGV